MKKWIPIFFVLTAFNCIGQDSSKTAPLTYKTYTSLPAFPLYSPDSIRFSSTSVVVKKQPTLVIYFSPTCGHCQHQAEEITGHIKQLEKVSILMVSSHPLSEIRPFIDTYAINHFPNITVGCDPDFSMGKFYELKSMPGIFVYDKKGKLKKAFDTNVKIEDLIAAIGE